MATRITIMVPDRMDAELAGISHRDLEWLLRDALYEFKANRHNGDGVGYVNKRYPVSKPDEPGYIPAYTGNARIAKAQQVVTRCRWAKALHAGHVQAIDHVPEYGDY